MELKLVCDCGQKFKFDVEPVNGEVPFSIVCPSCGTDATAKANALLAQLNATLDMERGGQVAQNLRALYEYMMNRLTLANATNDTALVAEVAGLVEKIKSGWDQIVTEAR